MVVGLSHLPYTERVQRPGTFSMERLIFQAFQVCWWRIKLIRRVGHLSPIMAHQCSHPHVHVLHG